ncbi:MAG TPA: PDZ domain-containing protein [Actinomycetales bacterium]|nr:PDZ domain-containing protein [Actinomycetales bacterium]
MSDLGFPAPPHQERPGLSPRAATILVCAFLSVLLGALITLLPAPYVVYSPGPATNVLGKVGGRPLISISGHDTYPTAGTLDMTTVEIFGGPGRRLSFLEVAQAWVSPTRAVVPEAQVYPPGQTQQQVENETAAEMTDSQQEATAAGLRELGLTVPETITVAEVQKGAPVASVIKVGDVITGLNGVPATDSAGLRKAITSLEPDTQVTVQVRRDGRALDLQTTTTSSDGRTVLGVGLDPKFQFPVDVSFGTKDVGGPSAGMMFALGIYDKLTPGALTGGARVAGTGTIDSNGDVGPIGGIQQKLVGARDAGADWFLAPADNCDEVVGHVPDGLRVVRTSSLHQSRLAVEAIAAGRGDTLTGCSR